MAPKADAKAPPAPPTDMRSFVGIFPLMTAWTTLKALAFLSICIIAGNMGYIVKDSSEDFTKTLEQMKEAGQVLAVAYRHREYYTGNLPTMARGVKDLYEYSEQKKDVLIEKRKYYAELFVSGLQALAGWKTHGGQHRYYVSKGKKTWHEAQRFCRERSAHLASIHTAEEQSFITAQLRGQAWIGLHDADKEGRWRWSDNSWFTTQYWADGEPSDAESRQRLDQDCASIAPSVSTYNWKDEPCDQLHHWVCKQLRGPSRSRKQ